MFKKIAILLLLASCNSSLTVGASYNMHKVNSLSAGLIIPLEI